MPRRIAVIGAGPCGSLMGRLLAKDGHEVLLFEEHEEVGRPRHCTGLVSRDLHGRYGISEKRAHVLEEFSEAQLIYGNRSLFIGLTPRVEIIDREEFEVELAQMAVEAGAQLRLGQKVTGVFPASGGKRKLTFEGKGSKGGVTVDSVVDCSGAMEGLTGVQYEFEGNGPSIPQVYFERKVPREYFYWIVPEGTGKYIAGTAGSGKVKDKLDAFLASHTVREKVHVTRIVRAFGGLVVIRPPGSPYSHKFKETLAAGDAANQVKITTGGGLLFAADSAFALARSIGGGEARWYMNWFEVKKTQIRTYAIMREIYRWLPSPVMESAFKARVQDYLDRHPFLFDQHWKYFKGNAPALLAALIS